MGKLLKADKEDRSELIGRINAYDGLYNRYVRELARIRNSEKDYVD
jgi:hypothetical protein